MPHRKFENPKALIDYAEQNGLVYAPGLGPLAVALSLHNQSSGSKFPRGEPRTASHGEPYFGTKSPVLALC